MENEEKLIVIRKKNVESDVMHITYMRNFEWVRATETYDKYGFLVSAENAGDYCLENSTCDRLREEFLNAIKLAGFEVKEDDTFEDFVESENAEIKAFTEKWREKNESYNNVLAWNYFDGHNWRTITIDSDNYDCEANYEKMENEESEEILRLFNEVYFDEFNNGFSKIKKGGYTFVKSQFAGNPFWADVTKE